MPAGSKLRGLVVRGHTVEVDLDSTFYLGGEHKGLPEVRLAQVLFTLTTLPDITGVTFLMDGAKLPREVDPRPAHPEAADMHYLAKPVHRVTLQEFGPQIEVTSPAAGELVSSPVTIDGVDECPESQQDPYLNLSIVDSTGAEVYRGSAKGFPIQVDLSGAASGAATVTISKRSRNRTYEDWCPVGTYVHLP